MSGAPIYTILSADSGVSALVGTRIYPMGIIPQEVTTFPVLTYQTVTGATDNVQGSIAPDDHERIQIDCWSQASLAEAQTLADAVRAAFENLAALNALKTAATLSTFNGHDYEPETKRFKVSTDWDFYTLR
jgi:hypothetical protein